MLNSIFYLFVAIGAFCGFQRGAAKAGYDFTAVGMAVYYSIWLFPLSLMLLDYVPAEYSKYAFWGILLFSAVLLGSLIRAGIDKLLENYPRFDSEIVLSEIPLVNGVFGGIIGAGSGFCVITFLFFFVSFSPFEIPYASTEEFNNYVDKKVLCVSKTVNHFSAEEWNGKQQDYLKEITNKFRTYGKPPAPPEEEKKEPAPAPVPAKEQAPQELKDVQATPENQQAQTPETPQAPQNAEQQGQPAAQKYASKAVKAVDKGQNQVMKMMESAKKNAAVPNNVKEELAGEGAKIVRQALANKKKMKPTEAAVGTMELISSLEPQNSQPVEQEQQTGQTPAEKPHAQVLTTAMNPEAADVLPAAQTPPQTQTQPQAQTGQPAASAVPKSLPGVAAPWSTKAGKHEIHGVVFTILVPEVNEDGTNSEHTRGIKLGIRLPEDGKVPKLIDIYVPHPIRGYRDRVIYRKIRVDMSLVTSAFVRNLKPELDTRYEIVDTE